METRNLPKINSLAIAEVSKITRFGAYCKLPEYGGLEVFLPLREISSGWIKNIHEFLHQNQRIVCKIIYIDNEKKTIDVSLKKVTPKDSKEKINTYNLERRLTNLFNQIVKRSKLESSLPKLTEYVANEFGSYTNLFYGATNNTNQFKNSSLPESVKNELKTTIEANRKKKRYPVSYILSISTENFTSGITELNKALSEAQAKKGVAITYISAPKYRMTAEGTDYADAEKKISETIKLLQSKLKDSTVEAEKEKLKKEKEDIMNLI